MFSLTPGYRRELAVFKGWSKDGAVEINDHDTAALGIPEQVGITFVAVVNALGPDGLRRTVPLCPQIRRVHSFLRPNRQACEQYCLVGAESAISASSSELLSDGPTFRLATFSLVRDEGKRHSGSSSSSLSLSRRGNAGFPHDYLDRKGTTRPVGAAVDVNSSPRSGEDDGASDDSASSPERKCAASSYGSGHLASAAFALSRAASRIAP
ncbi:unnamed protein product [Clonostachys chloroleuca]|uniref:Uncharacterized protein n=1 Tax=Clonostachys chloroleuca TaxID=1926264 RepID=A0AA35M565_9HYPO|nr:unnamed protein product [Clonostachys chloroleuca]